MQNILLIDSDEQTLTARGDQLLLDGYEVLDARAERQARHHLATSQPDAAALATLDTPAKTLALLRDLRASQITGADPQLPVLTIGADSDSDAVRHYQAGATIALPTAASPLLISAGLRSLETRDQPRRLHRIGNLTIDTTARVARAGHEPLRLTRLEFDLIATLASQPNRAIPRAELINDVWGYDPGTAGHKMVDVHLSRLRGKLEDAGVEPQLHNVRGIGFRLSQ